MFDGAYDIYIWLAYGVCFGLLAVLCLASLWSLRQERIKNNKREERIKNNKRQERIKNNKSQERIKSDKR